MGPPDIFCLDCGTAFKRKCFSFLIQHLKTRRLQDFQLLLKKKKKKQKALATLECGLPQAPERGLPPHRPPPPTAPPPPPVSLVLTDGHSLPDLGTSAFGPHVRGAVTQRQHEGQPKPLETGFLTSNQTSLTITSRQALGEFSFI